MTSDPFFHPVSGFELPRFAGVPTFMRLPYVPQGHARYDEVQLGLIGVPWDSGTTNRPGPRHGPRQLRDASTMIRAQHATSGMRPPISWTAWPASPRSTIRSRAPGSRP